MRSAFRRGLVVHANTHGFDNSVDLDAVAQSGGRYLAVVRLDASATPQGCEALHAGAPAACASLSTRSTGMSSIERSSSMCWVASAAWLVRRIAFRRLGAAGLRNWLASIPAAVVIDHMGRIDPSLGVDQEPFRVLLDLARRDNVWIKLSGADRLTRYPGRYDDVVPFAHRLLECTRSASSGGATGLIPVFLKRHACPTTACSSTHCGLVPDESAAPQKSSSTTRSDLLVQCATSESARSCTRPGPRRTQSR
jgi:hypothetical protein